MQTTLGRAVAIAGIGLHSGQPARLVLHPAPAGYGIVFVRTDAGGADRSVPALWDLVCDTALNTTIGNAAGVTVSTVEHLMAAFAGLGVANARVEIDGPECPIMDGSALAFVEGIRRAGIVTLDTPRAVLRVTRRVEVEEGGARASFEPAARLEIDFEIAFPDAAIGVQRFVFSPADGRFEAELAMCRTFCRRAEVEWMRDRGLIRGGSLDNAVVVEGGQVLTPGGFRVERECVRHKVLDALGDLALAGLPILGRYTGVRAGHALTNRLLRRLFAEPGAVEHVAAPVPVRRRVPAEAFELSL